MSATVFCPNSTHDGSATDHHNCVVDRIEIFEHVLSDSNASRDDRIEALKFLVHFVGDVHQPVPRNRGGSWREWDCRYGVRLN